MAQPNPEFRQRVRALAEGQWREAAVQGARLVRRFFWNVFRGTVGGLVSAVLSIGGGGGAHVFGRLGKVAGPRNAQALRLVDAARSAKGPWLVYSPSHVAVVDSGHTFHDPAHSPPPAFLWQAAAPQVPAVSAAQRRITWPDGSVFEYHITAEEAEFLERAGG